MKLIKQARPKSSRDPQLATMALPQTLMYIALQVMGHRPLCSEPINLLSCIRTLAVSPWPQATQIMDDRTARCRLHHLLTRHQLLPHLCSRHSYPECASRSGPIPPRSRSSKVTHISLPIPIAPPPPPARYWPRHPPLRDSSAVTRPHIPRLLPRWRTRPRKSRFRSTSKPRRVSAQPIWWIRQSTIRLSPLTGLAWYPLHRVPRRRPIPRPSSKMPRRRLISSNHARRKLALLSHSGEMNRL